MIRILIILILLSGCSSKQILPTPIGELNALNNFWKLLGGDKKKKEDD